MCIIYEGPSHNQTLSVSHNFLKNEGSQSRIRPGATRTKQCLPISGECLKALQELSSQAEPQLQRLKVEGVVSRDAMFMSLKPDYTRFLLKDRLSKLGSTGQGGLMHLPGCLSNWVLVPLLFTMVVVACGSLGHLLWPCQHAEQKKQQLFLMIVLEVVH